MLARDELKRRILGRYANRNAGGADALAALQDVLRLWRQQSGQLRSDARQWLPPQRQAALNDTEANVDALGEQLRRLHREQRGLQLPM